MTATVIAETVRYEQAVITVEPFEATLRDGRTVVIEHFFAWVANGGYYPEARGRVIRKDGTPGVRVQTWWDVRVPADMAARLVELCN